MAERRFGLVLACAVLTCACAPRSNDGDRHPGLRAEAEPNAMGAEAAVDASSVDAALTPQNDSSTGVEPPIDAGIPTDASEPAPDARSDAAQPPIEMRYGELAIEVQTKASQSLSSWSPRNLFALWIEDAAAMPIKVLAHWGAARASGLREYSLRVGNGTIGSDAPFVDVDTITGASLRAHELHSATWDMTDYRGQPVADGAYTIVIESTDNLDESYVTELTFIKGREPTHVEIEETTSFGPIVLTYTPAP